MKGQAAELEEDRWLEPVEDENDRFGFSTRNVSVDGVER